MTKTHEKLPSSSSLNIVFILANDADSDEMLHIAASNLGLHMFVNVSPYGIFSR